MTAAPKKVVQNTIDGYMSKSAEMETNVIESDETLVGGGRFTKGDAYRTARTYCRAANTSMADCVRMNPDFQAKVDGNPHTIYFPQGFEQWTPEQKIAYDEAWRPLLRHLEDKYIVDYTAKFKVK